MTFACCSGRLNNVNKLKVPLVKLKFVTKAADAEWSKDTMSGVLGWGKADNGQLGLKGEEVDRVLVPKQIPNIRGSEVVDIGCGDNHTLVCLKDGSLYTCGSNDFNQVGHSKSTKRFGE